ncbi:MAG: cbb3-type cytochrome oxidase assembly protein CcoS [Gammaproteobacteria bacterium]|nr:cbb3-type cytochrome oxidase assembly protein CcoS [Gammaproteobacteria bacterium]
MDVLIYLIPTALILSFIGLMSFFWTLKNNQYEDLKGASNRILFDDDDDRNRE